jgi:acyl-CoA reductase-like NAD-dependent aldehyde dehydrogenase
VRHACCPARAEVVEYACGIAPDLRGDYIEHVAGNMDTYSFRQPLGVRRRPSCITSLEFLLSLMRA